MFEKEVMISSLKKNSQSLSKLVEELEDKARFDDNDVRYYHETLKRIETAIRKIRKMDEEASLVARIW